MKKNKFFRSSKQAASKTQNRRVEDGSVRLENNETEEMLKIT